MFLVLGILVAFELLTYLSVSKTTENFRACDVLDIDDPNNSRFADFDSVTGTMPIAFLDTLKGGLGVLEQGGGNARFFAELFWS